MEGVPAQERQELSIGSPLDNWREEAQRQEAAAEELRERHRDVLEPILGLTEHAPRVFDTSEQADEYRASLRNATATVIVALMDEENEVGTDELYAFLEFTAGVSHDVTRDAISTFLCNDELRLSTDYSTGKRNFVNNAKEHNVVNKS